MKTTMSISMYPEYAFIHIYITSDYGYKYSACNQVSIEEAKRLSLEFNIPIH